MKRAFPIDFSYKRSDSSGTSIPAGPPDKVVREKPCPMIVVVWKSCHSWDRYVFATADNSKKVFLSHVSKANTIYKLKYLRAYLLNLVSNYVIILELSMLTLYGSCDRPTVQRDHGHM